jgi:hypothetical protein
VQYYTILYKVMPTNKKTIATVKHDRNSDSNDDDNYDDDNTNSDNSDDSDNDNKMRHIV